MTLLKTYMVYPKSITIGRTFPLVLDTDQLIISLVDLDDCPVRKDKALSWLRGALTLDIFLQYPEGADPCEENNLNVVKKFAEEKGISVAICKSRLDGA